MLGLRGIFTNFHWFASYPFPVYLSSSDSFQIVFIDFEVVVTNISSTLILQSDATKPPEIVIVEMNSCDCKVKISYHKNNENLGSHIQ